ncbi:MAG: phosphotriesterase-related protein [Chloroflexota bacterium]|nr:phosphotriesterase-related protein [Chloroflexota bacterium]
MATINSVLGPLDTAQMGFTLSHEHVIVTSAGIQQVYPEFLDRAGSIRKGVAGLRQAHSEGVRTIVDVTTMDLGLDVRLLEEVSRKSGVQIICATGTWLDIPRVFWAATPDMIAPLYIREIERGIEGTGIKAGIIKVANDMGGVTREGEIVLRAAARAQKATGVPISTHTWAPECVGEQQVRIFEDEGVDLNSVYIGHSNDTTDIEYLIGLLKKGVWLGMDRFPGGNMPGTPNWEGRAETIARLVTAGYAHRLMLGHDWSVTLSIASQERQAERQKRNPDGYLFITRRVLPRLLELGVSQQAIDQMMVDNPRRFFEGKR